jgi:hypothetical protein
MSFFHPVGDGFGVEPVFAKKVGSAGGRDAPDAGDGNLFVFGEVGEIVFESGVVVLGEFVVDGNVRASWNLPLLVADVKDEYVLGVVLSDAACNFGRLAISIFYKIQYYTTKHI